MLLDEQGGLVDVAVLAVPVHDETVESTIHHVREHRGDVAVAVTHQSDVDVIAGPEPRHEVCEPPQVGPRRDQRVDMVRWKNISRQASRSLGARRAPDARQT